MSVSQFKEFAGTIFSVGCEACAIAKLRGEWIEEPSIALLVGSYVDAHFEGTLSVFKVQHPEILRKDGELKSEYVQANEIIARIERDPYFMKFMSGEKQSIFTWNLFGCEWKCKIDSYLPGICLVDLKVMKSLRDKFWTKKAGKISFVQEYGYDIQAAIYQEIVFQNTRERLLFFIAGASKEKEPDIEIIGFDKDYFSHMLFFVELNMPRILQVKKGEVEPIRCGVCDYCKNTKLLKKPIHFSELIRERI